MLQIVCVHVLRRPKTFLVSWHLLNLRVIYLSKIKTPQTTSTWFPTIKPAESIAIGRFWEMPFRKPYLNSFASCSYSHLHHAHLCSFFNKKRSFAKGYWPHFLRHVDRCRERKGPPQKMRQCLSWGGNWSNWIQIIPYLAISEAVMYQVSSGHRYKLQGVFSWRESKSWRFL